MDEIEETLRLSTVETSTVVVPRSQVKNLTDTSRLFSSLILRKQGKI